MSIIVSIAVSLLLYFSNKSSKKEVLALDNGSYELRMNKMYQIIGFGGMVLGVICLLIPVLANEYTSDIFIISGFLAILFLGLSVPCFLWYRNHSIKFDDKEVFVSNVYGKGKAINWSMIDSASFKPFAGVMALSDDAGNIIKIHSHLVGFSTFMKTLITQRDKYGFNCGKLPPNLEA